MPHRRRALPSHPAKSGRSYRRNTESDGRRVAGERKALADRTERKNRSRSRQAESETRDPEGGIDDCWLEPQSTQIRPNSEPNLRKNLSDWNFPAFLRIECGFGPAPAGANMKRSFASLNPQEALHVAIFIEERHAELY